MTAMFVWRINPYIIFLPALILACINGSYLSATLTKVPSGAWFTIALALVLAAIILLWRYGKEQQWLAEAEDRFPTSHFMAAGGESQRRLSNTYGNAPLSTCGGIGIFFNKVARRPR